MLQRILLVLFLFCLASPAFAGFDEGKKAYDKKDWLTAIRQLRPLAEQGDDRAQILLANMYYSGYGVIVNYEEARALYRRAAVAKNNPQAMDALAAMYVSATGVDQNLPLALQWFRRSAELGDQTGGFFYAMILAQGNKTKQAQLQPDPYTAYKWFRIVAGENQNKVFSSYAAKIAQGIITRKLLTAEQAAKADREAAAWKPADPKTLGPAPADTPPKPQPLPPPVKKPVDNSLGNSLVLKGIVPVPAKNSPFKNSSPPPAATDKSLPHSEPLKK